MEDRLVKHGRFAHSGVYDYSAQEIPRLGLSWPPPPEIGEKRMYSIYRPAPVLVTAVKDGLFTNMTLTRQHPDEWVDPDNWKKHAVGMTGDRAEVEWIGDEGEVSVNGTITLADRVAVESYDRGILDLSPGYSASFEWRPGVTSKGRLYDAVMTRVNETNHLSMVDKGRGGVLSVITDSAAGVARRAHEVASGLWWAVKRRWMILDGVDGETAGSAATGLRAGLEHLVGERATLEQSEVDNRLEQLRILFSDLPYGDEKSLLMRYIDDLKLIKDMPEQSIRDAVELVCNLFDKLDGCAMGEVMSAIDANWEESKHPRGEAGKFSSGGGGGTTPKTPGVSGDPGDPFSSGNSSNVVNGQPIMVPEKSDSVGGGSESQSERDGVAVGELAKHFSGVELEKQVKAYFKSSRNPGQGGGGEPSPLPIADPNDDPQSLSSNPGYMKNWSGPVSNPEKYLENARELEGDRLNEAYVAYGDGKVNPDSNIIAAVISHPAVDPRTSFALFNADNPDDVEDLYAAALEQINNPEPAEKKKVPVRKPSLGLGGEPGGKGTAFGYDSRAADSAGRVMMGKINLVDLLMGRKTRVRDADEVPHASPAKGSPQAPTVKGPEVPVTQVPKANGTAVDEPRAPFSPGASGAVPMEQPASPAEEMPGEDPAAAAGPEQWMARLAPLLLEMNKIFQEIQGAGGAQPGAPAAPVAPKAAAPAEEKKPAVPPAKDADTKQEPEAVEAPNPPKQNKPPEGGPKGEAPAGKEHLEAPTFATTDSADSASSLTALLTSSSVADSAPEGLDGLINSIKGKGRKR